MSRVRQMELFAPVQPLVERLGAEFFRSIPELPGVYRFCAEDGTILYIGKAKNLRDRLGSYRSLAGQARKTRRLICRAVRIEWDLCASEAEALLQEARLIKALKPRFNRAGVWSAPPWQLRLKVEGGELILSACAEASEGAGEGTIGPLRSGHRYLLVIFARTLWLAGQGFPEPQLLPRPLLFPEIRWSELRVPMNRIAFEAIDDFLRGNHVRFLEQLVTDAGAVNSAFTKAFVGADLEYLQHFWDHHPLRREQPSAVDSGVVKTPVAEDSEEPSL